MQVMTMKASSVVIPIAPAIELQRILYATDLSDASLAALPLVSTIAHQYGSQVFVMNVSTSLSYAMISPEAAVALQQTDELTVRSKVQDLLKAGDLAGLSATAVVRSGFPTEEIERFVREQRIDLAILGTHGRTGMRHLIMGSVAEELFRHLPCPVLTVGPNISKASMHATDIRHILFPTDLSAESQAVFPYLASLASQYKAALTLLHVLPVETAANPDARSLAGPLRNEMQNIFASHMDPRCPAEFVIDFGEAAERILAHAETGRADLIGLGVRKAGEITTHFRNTVAYRVVLQAHCPVLTARYSG
jgi:nucleotide-binding universal stress UspA family protein